MSTLEIPCPDTGRTIELDLEPRYDTEGDAAMGAAFLRAFCGHEVASATYADTGEPVPEITDEMRQAAADEPVSVYDPANDL